VAGVVAFGEGSTDASQTEDTPNGRGSDGFEGLAAGSRRRQGFGEVVKAGWFHLFLFFLEATMPHVEKYCKTTRRRDERRNRVLHQVYLDNGQKTRDRRPKRRRSKNTDRKSPLPVSRHLQAALSRQLHQPSQKSIAC
jgi:hypothetical protein